MLLAADRASADIKDFIGRPLVDVRVELAGAPFGEPAILQLIETRLGEPLSMERVRETIDHLVGLGRFEDVRVFAEPSSLRPDSVALRWVLTPVQRIGRIEITGNAAVPADVLRDQATERVGALPPTSRVTDIIQVLEAYYRDRGYRSVVIQPRVERGRVAEQVTLVLEIEAGPRTTIERAAVSGDPVQLPAAVLARLGLERGRPFDRPLIEQRLAAFADELRGLGYYEAGANLATVFSEDGRTVSVTVSVDRGPRVVVRFAGDPLPENRRDTLVPIREERSVDLDLLEDASRNIEAFLREQGYRSAQARYTREQTGDEMVLTFTVARGPLYRLASLDVAGNAALPRDRLLPLLKLGAGEPFVESRVGAVAAAIAELYRVEGFARVSVKADLSIGASTEVDPARTAAEAAALPVNVRLIITEGARTIVRAVDIQGAAEVPAARLRSLLTLTAGRPYYRPLLDADRLALEQLYRDEGFQNVRVEAETVASEDGAQVDVTWDVREGARTIVDHILVSGNERTSADLIRREVVLEPGRPLSDTAIIESQRRLAALGLFRRIRIVELPHGTSGTRDVLIEVEEAPPTTISGGGGVEASRRLRSEQGVAEERIEIAPRGFFEVTRRNLWGKNRSISGFVRVSFRPRDPPANSPDPTDEGGYGFNEYRVFGAYREPRPFDAPGDLQVTGFIEQAIRTSFNFRRRGVRAEYGRRVRQNLTVSGRYNFDHTRLFDEQIAPEDRVPVDRLFPQVRLSTFTGSVLRDSRNDVLDPERGAVLGVDATVAARALGSEVGFFKTFTQAFAYRRLPGARDLIVVAGARLGLAFGFERFVEATDANGMTVVDENGNPIVEVVDDVPASERFFAGGDTTVRGFVLDRLGTEETLDDQGFPNGGGGLLVMNVELRTPYWKGLGAVGFLDAGNVFLRPSDIDFTEIRPTVGLGMRYRSPIGPLRVDFGFNLDRRLLPTGQRERGMVFHISLGQAF